VLLFLMMINNNTIRDRHIQRNHKKKVEKLDLMPGASVSKQIQQELQENEMLVRSQLVAAAAGGGAAGGDDDAWQVLAACIAEEWKPGSEPVMAIRGPMLKTGFKCKDCTHIAPSKKSLFQYQKRNQCASGDNKKSGWKKVLYQQLLPKGALVWVNPTTAVFGMYCCYYCY